MVAKQTSYKVAILIEGNDNLATILKALEGAATVCSIEVVGDQTEVNVKRSRKPKTNFNTKMIEKFAEHLRTAKVKTLDRKLIAAWCESAGYSSTSYSWVVRACKAKGILKNSSAPGKEDWFDVTL